MGTPSRAALAALTALAIGGDARPASWSLPTGPEAQATAVTTMPAGGTVVAGRVSVADAGTDGWIAALDAGGAVAWTTAIGTANDDTFSHVGATPDGRLRLAGVRDGEAWICAVAADGSVEWELAFDAGRRIGALAVGADGSVVVAWPTGPDLGVGVERISADGAPLATSTLFPPCRQYLGSPCSAPRVTDALLRADGTVILSMSVNTVSSPNGYVRAALVVALDADLQPAWAIDLLGGFSCAGAPLTSDAVATDLAQAANGDVLVAGGMECFVTAEADFVGRLAPDGTSRWTKHLRTDALPPWVIRSVGEAPNGTIWCASVDQESRIHRLGADGSALESARLGPAPFVRAIAAGSDGNVIAIDSSRVFAIEPPFDDASPCVAASPGMLDVWGSGGGDSVRVPPVVVGPPLGVPVESGVRVVQLSTAPCTHFRLEPVEIVRVAWGAAGARLEWEPSSVADSYDLLVGPMSDFTARGSGSPAWSLRAATSDSCALTALAHDDATFGGLPRSSDLYWVIAARSGTKSTIGSDSSGERRPATSPCP